MKVLLNNTLEKQFRNSINWNIIYRNNYYCTLETKLLSFQIKLHLTAIVTNVQLHGFGLKDSNL